ncbi:MAG TPA: alpha/beta hydrolase [Candidatus Kapabacteria bacterium]|nr:alpha/beta hydrolase [Candidatus Kapabacteria bacterium]
MRLNAPKSGKIPPIIFLHAFPLNKDMWNVQISGLSGKFQVITPNLPGFGDSILTYPNISIELFADAVASSLTGMGIEDAVIGGISMGGYVALELWRKYPHMVKVLILTDTRAEADSPEARANRQRQIALIKEGKHKEVITILIDKLVSDHTKKTSPEIFDYVRKLASRTAPEALMFTIEALAGRRDSTGLLATINVPTLIIVGENDTLTPPAASVAMHKAIKNSELCIIPNAGHLPPMECPGLFNECITTFLDKIL